MEILLTLAEELHSGRSAERLRLSPALHVRMTPVGEVPLRRLKPAYEGIQEAMAEVTTLARRSAGTLTPGGMDAQTHDLTPVLPRFRAGHPSAELRFQEVFFSDPFGALRAGEVDAVTTWYPAHGPRAPTAARARRGGDARRGRAGKLGARTVGTGAASRTRARPEGPAPRR
ncbi:hypothetical protein ACFUN8_30160 [Streptomyces sp. NPDC057307]|uniref:hypothetical protein n=1 Tax=Streptomyces sp. NPDC057307 TaxID=3346096 RepID=UPI0036363D49